MPKFPQDVQDFANVFITLQIKRHKADYDPSERVFKSEVLQDIDDAEDVIRRYKGVPISDRRAFAIYVLLKRRRDS